MRTVYQISEYLTRRLLFSFFDFGKDEVAQMARIRDSLDDKMLGGARRFHLDISEIYDSREEAVNVGRHVLYAVEEEARDLTAEEAELVDVNNASVGKEPRVKIIGGKGVEGAKPQKKPPDAKREPDPRVRKRRFFFKKRPRLGRQEGE